MQQHLTEMFGGNYSGKMAATPVGMAHLAGSGPRDRECRHCEHFLPTRKVGKCNKHRRLMNLAKPIGEIPRRTPACKYFEAKA